MNLQAYIIDNTIKFFHLLEHKFKHRTDVLLPCLHFMEYRCHFLLHCPQLMNSRKELLEIMHRI